MLTTYSRRERRQRGQGTVEFVLVTMYLAFFLFLVWQMSWVGVQKWYFSFTGLYSARIWSVQKDGWMNPQMALLRSLSSAEERHEFLKDRMPVIRIVDTEDWTEAGRFDDIDRFDNFYWDPPGIHYRGLGMLFGLFRPTTIESAGLDAGSDGTVIFETYVPIEHEESFSGPEEPGRYDNDR